MGGAAGGSRIERGRGLTARLEKLRDGGVVHGESTYLFKLSLES